MFGLLCKHGACEEVRYSNGIGRTRILGFKRMQYKIIIFSALILQFTAVIAVSAEVHWPQGYISQGRLTPSQLDTGLLFIPYQWSIEL